MRTNILIIIITIFMLSCQEKKANAYWSIAYKNDTSGNTVQGSKEQLINAIRQGASIKIGWGSKGKSHQIEHLASPIWIAVLDEKEVVAHLEPQVLSGTDWEQLTANYADTSLVKTEWRVAITTKGEFDAVWYNRKDFTLHKRRPQKHVITWFIKDVDNHLISEPLFKE